MPLVAAKCTQCGANIEVDDSKEAGICKFCGTAFVTEKAITNYNTYITNNNNFAGANINVLGGDVSNLLELARNALEIHNEVDVLKYCEKALEIDVKSSEAWYLKMQGEKIRVQKAGHSIDNAKSVEAIFVAGNNAIKYSNDADRPQRIKDVHLFYLESVTALLSGMNVSIQYDNVDSLTSIASINKNSALANDQMYLLGITTKELFVLKLIDQIEDEEFVASKEFQDNLIECINLYVEFRNNYKDRTLIYSGGPDLKAAAALKDKYENLINKLPTERRSEVTEWTLVGSSGSPAGVSDNNSGCYIATCVYGSYDCPQVWTLRRFRDYTLDSTWHGRLFIKCYYATSPTLVKWFGDTKWFRTFWKDRLDRIVSKLNNKGIEDTFYYDKY